MEAGVTNESPLCQRVNLERLKGGQHKTSGREPNTRCNEKPWGAILVHQARKPTTICVYFDRQP